MSNLVDIELLNIVMATAAANRMRQYPVWLMVVGASGIGKTEIVKTLSGLGEYCELVSSIPSEGALLSAVKAKDKKDQESSTGGLLRKIGSHGMLVFKDFTTILSMDNRNTRPQILAALRECHDGAWIRKVGADGGRSLEWKGHLGVIGCCTTSWDRAYAAIATMGDRFLVIRPDSSDEVRLAAGRQAMANMGKHKDMEYELRESVRKLLQKTGPHIKVQQLFPSISEAMLEAATIASKARTPVDRNYRGGADHLHDSESPSRMLGGLLQLMQGAICIGIRVDDAFNMAMRCMRDSIPPMRMRIIRQLMLYSNSTVASIADALQAPWSVVDPAVQDLHHIGMLNMERDGSKERSPKYYSIKSSLNIGVLWTRAQMIDTMPEADGN